MNDFCEENIASENSFFTMAIDGIATGNLNQIFPNGKTLLMTAVENKDHQMIKSILESGCNVNYIYRDELSALGIACANNDEISLKLLLDHGADQNILICGRTPLMSCIYSFANKCAYILLQYPLDYDKKSSNGSTALHVACSKNNSQVVSTLLMKGASPNVINYEGISPLWVASYYGNQKIVDMLVTFGAKINSPDNKGVTPLIAAIIRGHEKIFFFLIKHNADFHSPQKDNLLPVEIAILSGKIEILKFFSKYYKLKDVRIDDAPGICRYLEYTNRSRDGLKYLLSRGCDPNSYYIENEIIMTPLIICMLRDDFDCAMTLLEEEANPYLGKHITPISIAINYSNEKKDSKFIDLLKKYKTKFP